MTILRRVRSLPLNAALLLAVTAALLPIMMLSLAQGLSARRALNHMIGERLVAAAALAAIEQREPLMMARRMMETMADEDKERFTGADCGRALMQHLKARFPLINLERWGDDGRLLCSAQPVDRSATDAAEHWWPRIEADPHFSIFPPMEQRRSAKRVLILVQPLIVKGALAGAFTASLDLSQAERALADKRLSDQGVVGIADASGRLLTSSGPIVFSRINIPASNGRPAVLRRKGGGDWLYASAPIAEKRLYVFYAEPVKMAFSLSRGQLWVSIILPVCAIILSCFAVWLALDRFVLRWLRRVGRRTQVLAAGDYRQYPDAFDGAPKELSELGRSLDDMADAIAQRDRALRTAVAEKDAMAREVNHRVKNNLQMISSIVSLQAARLADPYARQLMVQTRLRVSALALVHRLIYELDGSERGLVDTPSLFHELCAQLESSFQPTNVRLRCRSEAAAISGDQAVSAALIVVEAVTNAFRHGFPAGASGFIDVLMREEGDQIVLTIADDGTGVVQASSVTGMGYDLMRALTEQLEGHLAMTNGPDQGHVVTVRFASTHLASM